MATVANLYINVGAKMKPLVDGMKRGSKSVKRFRSSAVSSFKGIAGGIAGIVMKVGKWIALVGGAAMAATVVIFRKMANQIDRVAKVSSQLGISVSSLQAFELAAKKGGVESEALFKGLQKMNRSISEAGMGLTTPIRGLDLMGVTLQELQRLSPDDQFMRIADGIKGITNPADQAAAAFAIFGRSGVELLPTLKQGSAGLEEFKNRAAELGLNLSQQEAANVEAFNDSLTDLGAMIKGALQQAVVGIAPFLTKMIEQMTSGAGFAHEFGEFAVTAFKLTAKAVAFTADVFISMMEVFMEVEKAFTWMIEKIVNGIKAVLEFGEPIREALGMGGMFTSEMLDPVSELIEHSKKGQEKMRDWLGTLNAQLGLQNIFNAVELDAIRAGAAVDDAAKQSANGFGLMGEAMMELAADSDAMIAKLEKQVETFGMSSGAAELYALKQRGASEATLETIRALHEQLDGLEKQRDMMAEGERVFDSVQTPLEKYEREIDKLEKLLGAGAINQDTFSRAVSKAREGLGGAGSATAAGSNATGVTDSIQSAVGSITLPGMRTMETTADKSLTIEKKSYDRLGDILEATRRGGSAGALV